MTCKFNSLLLWILFFGGIVSCCDDDERSGNSFVSITLNDNTEWLDDGNIVADFFHDDFVNISFGSLRNEGILRDALQFKNVFFEENVYEVRDSDFNNIPDKNFTRVNYTTFKGDGHLVGSYYAIDTSFNNYLEILEITNNEISGTFELQFIKDSNNEFNSQGDPDTIKMSEATFLVEY